MNSEARKPKKARGQAAIFMAIFVSTMIMLFAFTTNIGMLVHAKINLQNAADAAAYAGAAVQARQLTNAAYLNWEMRRTLKEFMFYYFVRPYFGTYPCFPISASGARNSFCPPVSGEARYGFEIYDPRVPQSEQPGAGPFIPTTCIIFDPENNYCQKASVAGIPQFPSGGGWGVADPIVAAVRGATAQIVSKKIADCEGRTGVNQQFLLQWLFSINPAPFDVTWGNDRMDPFGNSAGVERLGVLPRMALIRARIDNIEETLNMNLTTEGIGATLTDASLGLIRGASNPSGPKTFEYFERSLQAWLSARNNLPTVDGENGNFTGIELTELLPNQPGPGDQNPNLRNPHALVKFRDLTTRMVFANSEFFSAGCPGDAGACCQRRQLRVVGNFPFGIAKDPQIPTYYAVRLQAKARLLFSPFGSDGTVTLSAYSAAKPFGSRVGKDLLREPENFMVSFGKLRSADVYQRGLGNAFASAFPNVLVAEDDTASENQGFIRSAHLGYLSQAVRATGNIALGARLAGAYAPWEVGFYTPPASYNGDVIGKFEDNPIYEGKWFQLKAPIFPVNGSSTDLSFIRERVAQFLATDLQDRIRMADVMAFLSGTILSDPSFASLFGYLLSENLVEYHNIPDPLLTDQPDLIAFARGVGTRFTVAGRNDAYRRQLTSWNNQKTAVDTDLGIESNSELGVDTGRSGYSVRFVSFNSLSRGGRATNDPSQGGLTWENPFSRFDAADAAARIQDDISKIRH
jgi:hypothetical protein